MKHTPAARRSSSVSRRPTRLDVGGRRALVFGATLMLLLLGACAGSSTSSTRPSSSTDAATSDPAATKSLRDAAAAMGEASSFRFTSTITTGPTETIISGEFVAPDRVRQTVTVAGGAPTETVFIGTRAWVKTSAGAWKTRPTPPGPGEANPRGAFAALLDAKAVVADGDGYRFVLPASSLVKLTGGTVPGGQRVDLAARATVVDGRISGLTYQTTASSRSVKVVLTYADVGASLAIEPPA